MRIIGAAGREDIAIVYLAELGKDRLIEFVESVQPPIPREEKWVLIVSSMVGCPIKCIFCDAGGNYKGKLSKEEILQQIDYMVRRRYPNGKVPVKKFKIQFARVGEPSMNENVLKVLEELPNIYYAPGLLPCISTVAPLGSESFFEKLIEIKDELYREGRFQLQFSIHSTDQGKRDEIIPIKKWGFERIAEYGERFYKKGDRKITLNFALGRDFPISPKVLREYFDPSIFLIKITPVNPTIRAIKNRIDSLIKDKEEEAEDIVKALEREGYEVIVSIGELEENKIGSNCGQLIKRYLEESRISTDSYSYEILLHSS